MAKDLRRRGIKTGILSNTVLTVPWILQLLGGYRGFDPVVLSSKEGTAKPNPRIYRIAIERSGVKPENILFIDNLEENIAAAKKAGLKTVLAKNPKQIVRDVKAVIRAENGLQL